MAAVTFYTDFVKCNSVQFYEGQHSDFSSSAFDCMSYKEACKSWQTAKPYEQKATFDDMQTIMVHVQANNPFGGPSAYPLLQVFDINDNFIFTLSSGIFGGGSQQNPQNIGYPNGSLVGIPLDSYIYYFTFDDFLDTTTDSGIYYLKMTNTGHDGVKTQVYYSEPILVYNEFPNTIVISGQNKTNRESQKILINGWIADVNPTFSLRVEGYVNLYKPKSLYISYLQQQYLSQQLSSQNFRTFTLQIGGSVSDGVPDYMLEKVTEIMIMDNFSINDGVTTTPYVYDGDSDSSPKFIGSKVDPEASQLCWDKYSIREKYARQNAFYRVV